MVFVCAWHPEACPWQMVSLPFHLPPQVRLHRNPWWRQWSSRPAGQALWEHCTSYHHLFWPLSLYQVHLRLRTARCRLLPALWDLQDRWVSESVPVSQTVWHNYLHLDMPLTTFSMWFLANFQEIKDFFFFFLNLSKSVHHISKKMLVAHDSAFLDHSVAIKAEFLLKCSLVFEDSKHISLLPGMFRAC